MIAPTLTGNAADPIDALLHLTNGEVLASPSKANRGAGEWDYYREHTSTREIRRLVRAGLLRRGGLEPDRLAAAIGWDGDASSLVEWYFTTALAGLDMRADDRDGAAWHERERPEPELEDELAELAEELPTRLAEYLGRLIHAPKREHAARVALAIVRGNKVPTSRAAWARDVERKVRRYLAPTTARATSGTD